MDKLKAMGDANVTLQDSSFWSERVQLVRETVLPYQWRILNDTEPDAPPSFTIRNLRIAAKEIDGEFNGMVFQDSDLAKWLEAVGYSLATHPDKELERVADEVIDLLERAQEPNGYLDTYFIVKEPDKKWTNVRDWHELYCAGHLIEGAVAYFEATGKRKALDIVCRLVTHISTKFGPEPGKLMGYPGHEEIELALVKLYRATGDYKYLELSSYFIDERGQEPNFFRMEAEARKDPRHYNFAYSQAHVPVREQETAEGHSVRAMYLYSAMADLAKELDDDSLLQACRKLWNNVTQKKMYITGGIGSSAYEEAFTVDYDLPNDRAYTETCAAIGLVFWAHRMLQIDVNADYGDVMERALYNGVLSGMSMDGKKYFYVNPLEVWPTTANHRHDMASVKTTRQSWFGCACCPPNIARLLASIHRYLYSYDDEGIYVHLYSNSEARWETSGQRVTLAQQSQYPWDGHIQFEVQMERPAEFATRLRIPGWTREAQIRVNGHPIAVNVENGYATVQRQWNNGDQLELILPMHVERVVANKFVRANAGKVALQRGPIVYCVEEVDNGTNLSDIVLKKQLEPEFHVDKEFLQGVPYITVQAWRSSLNSDQNLYLPFDEATERVSTEIRAVPYFSWCNREPGEMCVWLRTE
ncbi:glycoside hydrolase family 127 protein [Alicyclobacillus fastidiosus]|uniref:Glycoside hydrolase family 127 protein n=2 Tax=Alicyclobacillus fastidiosus TaxID=392011 RepID=A0ABY6ZA92_9BACL|nr:beta-L-arabinofuranosidase domain-containing protein [Alicyclobacillus fastidiosus]WAH39803.1 glycoside hydrolase family 127 protein [Alicyclobacillus fastidiosus]